MEAVYEEALALELEEKGIKSEQEIEIPIYYKSKLMKKRYRMDLVVDDIIIELKSVSEILPAHRAQLCNYLRLTKKPVGLLINFGEKDIHGERWVYNEDNNTCYLCDKQMTPLLDEDYGNILYPTYTDEEWNQQYCKENINEH